VKKWSNASISATRSLLKTLLKEMVEGKPLGDHPVQDITVSMCKTLYNNLLEKRTLKTANQNMYTLSSLLDSAVDIELIPFNPVKSFSKITPEKRTEKTWTPDEVTLFLEEAYSDFKYRNIGLLVHMCYEWAQSIKTIVNLEWDSFDWDKEVVNINTGGKVVHIPLEDPLKSLLKKQKEDWDFQKYVIPLPTPSGNYYLPMSDMTISRYFNTVKDKVELGDKCKLAGLRTTAIKEMVEAGVDSLSIMQVTGHTKVESLTPYVDNTIQGAHRALTQRRTNR
jgi:integrase